MSILAAFTDLIGTQIFYEQLPDDTYVKVLDMGYLFRGVILVITVYAIYSLLLFIPKSMERKIRK